MFRLWKSFIFIDFFFWKSFIFVDFVFFFFGSLLLILFLQEF